MTGFTYGFGLVLLGLPIETDKPSVMRVPRLAAIYSFNISKNKLRSFLTKNR